MGAREEASGESVCGDGLAAPMSNAIGDGRSSSAEAHTEAADYVRSIVDTVREPLLFLDGSLQVRSANRTFRISPPDTVSRVTSWNVAGRLAA